MKQSLTSKTVRGLNWTILTTIINVVIQVAYTAIMARLLSPTSFGLIAMATVFLRFAQTFSQMGLSQAIIQKARIGNNDIKAAFTSSLLLSLCTFTVIWFIAPLSVYLLDNPQIVDVVRLMSLTFVIGGVFSTAWAIQRRNLDFKAISRNGIFSNIVGHFILGVILAYMNFGVWSLVIANLAQTFLFGVLSYFNIRHTLILTFRWRYYKPLLTFGSKISLIQFIEFVNMSLDTLIIGKIYGSRALGIYNRAYELVRLPYFYIKTNFTNVLFPAFSRVQKEKEKLKRAYHSACILIGYFMFPFCFGISAAAEQIVLVLLGGNWFAAIMILRIVAIGMAFRYYNTLGGIVCQATNALNQKMIIQTSKIFIGITLYALFGYYFGLVGFAIAYVIEGIYTNIAYYIVIRKVLNYDTSDELSAYIPGILAGLIIGSVIYLLSFLLTGLHVPQLIILLTEVLVGGLGLFSLLFLSPNKIIRLEIIDLLKKSFVDEKSNSRKTIIFTKIIKILS